ncbi:hypothetical protein DH2020_009442 [Rehmannia glutinosa]|uniref:Uncharacterized protein n=1 Tax=Rehmannia glutinosa TaxID=99300 RepID=A0ABR0X9B3_REHGL
MDHGNRRTSGRGESSNDAVRNEDDGDFEFALVREVDMRFSPRNSCATAKLGRFSRIQPRSLLNGEKLGARGENERLESSVAVPLSKFSSRIARVTIRRRVRRRRPTNWENIPAGTYCVWRPKGADQPSPSRCKKSKSTGSASKRWKFRDLLRSNSEGKDSFVF